MDQPESEGVRLLSFDGGDIRAVSQLLILDEFMRRVEWDRKSTTRILPCDYFLMMGGVGTGGIIVILLVTLRMGIEEAMEEFINIWTGVFAGANLDKVARSAKLEVTIKDLLERKGMPEDQKLCDGDGEGSSCKAFVCAVPESNLGICEKFRSYKSKETSFNPTIVEAIRATCAIPTLFNPVSIESVGCQASYVTGAYNFNNPAWEMIKEACETFGQSRLVACMLSLGCGQRPTSRLSQKNEAVVTSLVNDIASDSELVDRDLTWRIGKSNVYYRLSVDRILESGGDSTLGPIGEITSFTKVFLEYPTTVDKVNQCTKVSEQLGRVTLTDISGLSEPKPTTAHGLPSLSAFFVERPGLIKQMAQCLFRTGPPAQRKIVLSGLGGIGKTQITISFLRQFLSRFRHVLFIDGSSVQSIESGVIAKALEVLTNPDHEITRDWAIVYDNVDNRDINIADYFPHCSFGTIFITTRNRNLGNLAPNAHLELDLMSEEEAADVLLHSSFNPSHLITKAEAQEAREIAKELGYLPVALVQAGYFIKIHECMHDYRERLKKRRPDILSRPAQDQLDPHYHGVYATLNVTWPHLSLRAQSFMSILGFANYTGFPLFLLYLAADRGFLFEPFTLTDRPALFHQTIQLLCTTFRPGEESDKQDIDDVVAELERCSLVTRTITFMVTTLRLHPLVHSWTHDRLSQDEKEVYRAASVRLLVCGTHSDDQDLYEFIYPHVTLMSDRLAGLHINDRAGLAAVLAHQGDIKTAIELWEGIQKKVVALYGRNDICCGEADLQLARIYWRSVDQEQRDLASLLENVVVNIRKRTLGSEHPMTMKAIVQLARGMKYYGKQDEAACILRDALDFWERQHGDHWETIIQVKEELTSCYYNGEAINLCTEVLQARMQRSGPDHHATLRAMENLAGAYRCMRGKREDDDKVMRKSAIDTWISVVAARTNKRGSEHPDTLKAMESLAWSYFLGRFLNEAMAQWEKLVGLRKAVHGACHPDTLSTMEYLEICYLSDALSAKRKHKDLREEIVYLREEMVCLSKEAQGPSHKDTFSAMKTLARTCEQWKKYIRAEEMWKEVLCLTREVQRPSHGDTIEAMKALAKLYEAWEKYAEAEDQWKGILFLEKKAHGPNHEGALWAMRALANLYRLWGKYAESEAQWKEILHFAKEAHALNHEDTLDAMRGLANLYVVWGKRTEAEENWGEILRLTREIWGSNHKNTLDAMRELAKVYQRREKYPEAISQLEEILRFKNNVVDSLRMLYDMGCLARLYERVGRYNEAVVQEEEILQLKKDEKDTSDSQILYYMRRLAATYERCKQHAKATAQREEIVRLTKEMYGLIHHATLDAIEQLVKIYDDAEAYTEWETQVAEDVRLAREAKGPSHEDTIEAMTGLAKLYQALRKYAEAEHQWKEIIHLTKEARGPGSLDTLKATRSLAEMYMTCKRQTEAIAQLEEIVYVTRGERTLGTCEMLDAMESLVWLYEERDLYTKAVEQQEEIVQLTKDGKISHPDGRLPPIEWLTRMYMKLERYEDAETIVLDEIDRVRRGGEIAWDMEWGIESFEKLLREIRSRPARANDPLIVA